MKMSVCKSYGDLPLFLNAKLVAQVLGVSISSAYELMHEAEETWIENYFPVCIKTCSG